MGYRSFHKWKPNPSTRFCHEHVSLAAQRVTCVELAFSRTNGNTRLSPNLLVQQVTTQETPRKQLTLRLLSSSASAKPSSFMFSAPPLTTKQPIHTKVFRQCISAARCNRASSEHSGCTHASHHRATFELHTRIVQRMIEQPLSEWPGLLMESSCPHCVDR